MLLQLKTQKTKAVSVKHISEYIIINEEVYYSHFMKSHIQIYRTTSHQNLLFTQNAEKAIFNYTMSYDDCPKPSVLSPLNDYTRMPMVPLKQQHVPKAALGKRMRRNLTLENPWSQMESRGHSHLSLPAADTYHSLITKRYKTFKYLNQNKTDSAPVLRVPRYICFWGWFKN